MVKTTLERTIGLRELEYGNHVVRITVELVHGWFYYSMNSSQTSGVHRKVTAEAVFSDDDEEAVEVEHENLVYLEAEPCPSLLDILITQFTEESATDRWLSQNGPLIPSIETQVEDAVRPVFNELDDIYEFTTVEYEIDVEASVHRVKHDVSWVNIEDEVDRLCAEVDAMNA